MLYAVNEALLEEAASIIAAVASSRDAVVGLLPPLLRCGCSALLCACCGDRSGDSQEDVQLGHCTESCRQVAPSCPAALLALSQGLARVSLGLTV